MGHRRASAVRRHLAALGAVALAAAPGCAQDPPVAGRGQSGPLVVTSVSPITNVAANIAGAGARVVGLVPEGENAHEFEPPPRTARTLSDARLVFVNGLNLEISLEGLAAKTAGRDRIVRLGDRTIPRSERIFDFSFPESKGDPNPHAWTNPPYVKRYARTIATELSKADPGRRDDYERNLAAFEQRTGELDAAVRAASATLSPERRTLLTYHDSFPYFARDYGWTVVGAVQPSDFSEPSPRELAALVDQVRERRVGAIFGSEVFPSPVLERIARESGARYVDALRDDDLPGRPGDPGHSWFGLMQFNLVTIVEALGGDASALKSLDVSDVVDNRAEYPQ
ncbi:MAG TPA: metal ABC transporter substrate-binding protein [Actinomycetota bacterium]|nr:metal ABC transporter substrate-binding protein [Actinomycetota bacterium]